MLLESSVALTGAITSLFWITSVALVSPILSRLLRGAVPEVVLMLVLGAVIGPSVLALASTESGVELVREIGLGLLFLLAGAELDIKTMRGSVGRNAWLTWLLCLGAGLGVAWLFIPDPTINTALVLALAVTSTALGTLLPILKDRGTLGTPLGTAVMAHGAVGELGPILVMALLLGTRSTLLSALVLVAFFAAALIVALLPHRLVRLVPWLRSAISDGVDTTAQTAMRIVFWLLLALMALASVLELDVVLGAFAAGLLLRALRPESAAYLERRLEAIAFSFFVPVFFVTSGMNIDVTAVAADPALLAILVLMILLLRGGIVWARERFTPTGSGLTEPADQRRLGLYAATGLPIIVAVTELAT
ncbi:MAG: cation:proton antiporter, partial [Propioniciclava sp.]